MRYCSQCHYPIADDAKFCANCGASNEIRKPQGGICRTCGAQLSEGMAFCMNCGTPVAAPQPVQPVYQQPAAYTAPAPKKKNVGGIIAAVLALVLVLGGAAGFLFGLFGNEPVIELGAKPSNRQEKDDRDEDEDEEDEEEDEEEEENGREDETAAAEEPSEDAGPTEPAVQTVTLKVWVPDQDYAWVQEMADRFAAENPQYHFTVDVEIISEQDAGPAVRSDVAAGPDLYMYVNDQLGALVEAGALMALPSDYSSQVGRDNSRTMADSVTYYGNVYGFPYSANTWFLYYDKSVFSEQDVQSLDTMLTKGKVALAFSNGWYLGGFYAGAGASFFGSTGLDTSAGIRLTGGAEVSLYLTEKLSEGRLCADMSGGQGVSLFNQEVDAVFSGSWDGYYARNILGDNLGVVAPPMFNLNGRECRITPFLGSKAIGVNPYTDYPAAAMAFASYLASAEAQLIRYNANGTIPAHLGLLEDPAIAADPVALAQLQTIANGTVIQPFIPEMGNYWGPMSTLGEMLYTGQVTANNVDNILAEIEAAMNP